MTQPVADLFGVAHILPGAEWDLHGFGHMIPIELGSEAIAERVLSWLSDEAAAAA